MVYLSNADKVQQERDAYREALTSMVLNSSEYDKGDPGDEPCWRYSAREVLSRFK